MTETGDKIEVKTLKNTDLKPEDISRAIDDSAKALGPKPKAEPKAEAKPKASNKPKAEPKAEAKDDGKGSQIIVKKRNSYVGPAAAAVPSEAKPAETLTKGDRVELKPPSAQGKTVVAPTTDAKPANSTPATETSATVSESASTESKPAETKPEPSTPSNEIKAPPKSADEANKPQALKTFDTTEYHLPIKPTAGRHYLNAWVSWIVLILFLTAVSGYVMWQLEIIDPSQFGL